MISLIVVSVLSAAAGLLLSYRRQRLGLGFVGSFLLCALLTYGQMVSETRGMSNGMAFGLWLASGIVWLPFFLVTYACGFLLAWKPKQVGGSARPPSQAESKLEPFDERTR